MTSKRAIVYGGAGALGRTLVSRFRSAGWNVLSVDLTANDEANQNVVAGKAASLADQERSVSEQVAALLGSDKVNAILCVAGGWAGGNAASKDFISNTEAMIQQSLWTSLIAARLSSIHLTSDGLLVLTGAQAALKATPGMIGYGLAKSAVQHLVSSLAAKDGGLPDGASVAAILPVTLDTPMNRKWMPDADTTKWTPLPFIADTLFSWADSGSSRPASGSLVQLITENGETKLDIVSQ